MVDRFFRASLLACALTSVLACAARAETIATFSHAALEVTLEREAPGSALNVLEITSHGGAAGVMRFEAFTLPDPPRLVVDILEHQCLRSHRESVDDEAFKAIRFGGHPEKTRVVVDAKPESELRLGRIVSRGGEVVVRFAVEKTRVTPGAELPSYSAGEREAALNKGKGDVKPTSASQKREVESEAKPVDQTSPVEKARERPAEQASRQRRKRPSSAGPEAPKPLPPESTPKTQAEVTGISFEWLGDHTTPALAIAVKGLGRYSFGEGHARSYTVIIENARVSDSDVISTTLAPGGFRGVRAASTKREGDDVVVKIYVDKGTTLTPARAPGKLLVKVADEAAGTLDRPDTNATSRE